MLEVLQPGLYSTVQDKGRYGYRAYGVPLSGAMDQRARLCANWLCGNEANAAVLEMTGLGARFLVKKDCTIAISGGDMKAVCGDRPLANWQSHVCHAGEQLAFQYVAQGYRTYVALSGGVDVPLVMNSRSTYVRGKFGGLEGRRLQTGDRLAFGELQTSAARQCLPAWFSLADSSDAHTIRLLPGVQADAFSQEALAALCDETYEVGVDSDRMGYRFSRRAIQPLAQADIISDALIPGAVQIPGNGQPIIMLADCQTTGGYTKIAQVIQPDLDRLAQVQPGESIQFALVTEEQALAIRGAYQAELARLFETRLPAVTGRRFAININNKNYHVVVEEE